MRGRTPHRVMPLRTIPSILNNGHTEVRVRQTTRNHLAEDARAARANTALFLRADRARRIARERRRSPHFVWKRRRIPPVPARTARSFLACYDIGARGRARAIGDSTSKSRTAARALVNCGHRRSGDRDALSTTRFRSRSSAILRHRRARPLVAGLATRNRCVGLRHAHARRKSGPARPARTARDPIVPPFPTARVRSELRTTLRTPASKPRRRTRNH